MSKVKDYLEKNSKDLTNDVKETLSILYQMSDAKAHLLFEELEKELLSAEKGDYKTIPINQIIAHYEEIRVVNSNSTNIITEIKESIKDVLSSSSYEGPKKSSKLVDGIGGLVETTINSLLGATFGCENTKKQYYIATDGLALVRLDVIFWCRSVTISTIKTYAEKSLVCAIYKSTIDVSKINFNTFLAVYQEQLGRMKFEKQQLLDELNKAKEIYKLMREACSNDVAIDMDGEVDDSYIIGELESSTKKVTGDWPPIPNHLKK